MYLNLLFLTALFIFIYGLISLNDEWNNNIILMKNKQIEHESSHVSLDPYPSRAFDNLWTDIVL